MGMTVQRNETAAFKSGLDKILPNIRKALPAHVSIEKFERVVMMAVQKEPKLLECDRSTLFMECQKAAADGLLPDGREGVIVFRWNSKLGKNAAVWQPMVAGLMKLTRNSGEIASLTSQVVYEGEEFNVVLGDEERIEHKRSLDLPGDAKIRAAYAVATLKNGEKVREVMSWPQLERVRNVNSQWSKGPWAVWPDEMSRKTVMRRLAKKLPLSTDRDGDERLQQAIERDDTIDGDTYASAEDAAQVSGSAPAIQHEGGRLDALEGALTEEPEQEVIKAAAEPAKPAHDPSGGPGTVSSAADTMAQADILNGIKDANTIGRLEDFVERNTAKIDGLPQPMRDRCWGEVEKARKQFEQPRGRR